MCVCGGGAAVPERKRSEDILLVLELSFPIFWILSIKVMSLTFNTEWFPHCASLLTQSTFLVPRWLLIPFLIDWDGIWKNYSFEYVSDYIVLINV